MSGFEITPFLWVLSAAGGMLVYSSSNNMTEGMVAGRRREHENLAKGDLCLEHPPAMECEIHGVEVFLNHNRDRNVPILDLASIRF